MGLLISQLMKKTTTKRKSSQKSNLKENKKKHGMHFRYLSDVKWKGINFYIKVKSFKALIGFEVSKI